MFLQVGDKFQQSYRGCTKPMSFEVLDINRDKNEIKVQCTSFEGYSHTETWDDLDVTEMAFDIREYEII